jgi:cation transport ATPase
MTHTYQVSGMTCASCEAKVKSAFLKLPDVEAAEVSAKDATAIITMAKHIALQTLQNALQEYNGKYNISATAHSEVAEQTKNWLNTYKPILLIFAYISIVTIITASSSHGFNTMLAMRVFMAGFFLTFSFFKMLDLKGFAESYAMYDIVAKRWNGWGYAYAFVELSLGVAFLTGFQPVLTNSVTIIVMTVSIIGVLQSVLNKQMIRCACLGAVFNLPMSTVTIIEDALMIIMSGIMLVTFL